MRKKALLGVALLLLGGLAGTFRLGLLTACTTPAQVRTTRLFAFLNASESPLSRTLPQDYAARVALCQAVRLETTPLDAVRFSRAIHQAHAATTRRDEQVILATYAALVFEAHGYPQEAEMHFRQALQLSRQTPRSGMTVRLLAYQAEAALAGRDPSLGRARDSYRHLLSLAQQHRDRTARDLAYAGLYRVARAEGACDLLDQYRQALPAEKRPAAATFYLDLGLCDLRQGRYRKAHVALEAARSLQEAAGNSNGLAGVLLAEARLIRLLGRPADAQALTERAGALLDPGHRGLVARRWAEAGFIVAALGNRAQARTHFLLARETLLHGLKETQQVEIRGALRQADAVRLDDNLGLLEEILAALEPAPG